MNDFDQAGRRAVKDDPHGHTRWLFPRLPLPWDWKRWLESQSAPRPGEPDRRCDTIAELTHAEGKEAPWAAVIELFTASDADAGDRALEYRGRFRRELRHGPHGHDRYRFAMALVFFTGGPESLEVDETLPGGDSSLEWKPRLLCLEREDALATLRAIGENRLSLGICVWLALMKGGNTPEFVKSWRELVEGREADEQKRRSMASLAVVFAELTNCQNVWLEGLEGFGVNESTIMRQMRNEGRNEGHTQRQRDTLLRLLRKKQPEGLPAELLQRINGQEDVDQLSRWFDLALEADTVESFLDRMGDVSAPSGT